MNASQQTDLRRGYAETANSLVTYSDFQNLRQIAEKCGVGQQLEAVAQLQRGWDDSVYINKLISIVDSRPQFRFFGIGYGRPNFEQQLTAVRLLGNSGDSKAYNFLKRVVHLSKRNGAGYCNARGPLRSALEGFADYRGECVYPVPKKSMDAKTALNSALGRLNRV